jgi:hypothetical protein
MLQGAVSPAAHSTTSPATRRLHGSLTSVRSRTAWTTAIDGADGSAAKTARYGHASLLHTIATTSTSHNG